MCLAQGPKCSEAGEAPIRGLLVSSQALLLSHCALFFVHILSLVQPFFNETAENDRRNYFMTNLHESMGPGRHQLATPGSAIVRA